MKREMYLIRCKQFVQKTFKIVILDDPKIYSEYAPYKYVDDLREFMNQAGNFEFGSVDLGNGISARSNTLA